jgi:hypothetical protein
MTTSALAKPSLDVAELVLQRAGDVRGLALYLMKSCRIGASGFIASSTSITNGSTS